MGVWIRPTWRHPSCVSLLSAAADKHSGSLKEVIRAQVKGHRLAALKSTDLNVGEAGGLSLLTP